MVMTADQLTKGQTAIVVACNDQQMQDIGFIPNETLKIIAIAPMNGPKAVRIGQSTFAVHNEELATVKVKIAK
jgi:hypothetical protein